MHLPTFFMPVPLALRELYNCPIASVETLIDIDKLDWFQATTKRDKGPILLFFGFTARTMGTGE